MKQQGTCLRVLYLAITLMGLTSTGYALSSSSLFEPIVAGEPWDKGLLFSPKTVFFNKNGGDATEIAKVTLRFFTTVNCSGDSDGDYTTLDSSQPFPISDNIPFGLTAAGAWNVAVGIPVTDINTIQSVAIFLKSTLNTVPQADFTGSACGTNPSFCCVPITCAAGECTGALGTQDFQLKTVAAVGDPAEGAVIGCLVEKLVVPTSDNSSGIQWAVTDTVTNASSASNGATNTSSIVGNQTPPNAPADYAAGLCSVFATTGGFTTGWFLPAISQLDCLYNNRATITGFNESSFYWNSFEANISQASSKNFANNNNQAFPKSSLFSVRCARSYT